MSGSSVMAMQACIFICLCFLIYHVTGNGADKVAEFDVKPGGQIQHYEENLYGFVCGFTYACQGGTNEKWTLSIAKQGSAEITCTIERPERKSYLFFQQFKLEVTGASVQDAQAFSGPDTALKPEEFTVDKVHNSVSHVDGKFQSSLTRLSVKATLDKKEEL